MVIFGYIWKPSEWFGNLQKMFGNLQKIVKKMSLVWLYCLHNKQNNTLTACRYGISLLIFNLISQCEVSSWMLEEKFNIYNLPCIFLFVIKQYTLLMTFFMIFWRFPNTLQRFPKILQKLSEGQTIVSVNISQKFPNYHLLKYGYQEHQFDIHTTKKIIHVWQQWLSCHKI